LDNRAIARILGEIADLLEIKDDNPFKIRAYRNGAEIVANHPHDLAALDAAGLREIPGIGKDLAARILEVAASGDCELHRTLAAEFPPTVLELMRLQGIGPRTTAVLYKALGVRSLADLERAALDGRVRSLKGMGPKREALILKALDDHKRHSGRLLLADACQLASTLTTYLHERQPDVLLTAVGSLRRGCESCGDIDILCTGGDAGLMDAFVEHPSVIRVLARGAAKSSVMLNGGFQADLRQVTEESRGAALQYFTGSKAHNVALRNRAIGRGLKLNEYGIFRGDTAERLAGATEEEVYAALGLAWIPPELREDRGEIEAAAGNALPHLIERSDLRGDLHMHTTQTDGRCTIETMARAAAEAGLEYIAITDHSQSLAMANGLDEQRALAHAARIRALDGISGVRVMAGIECDILPDGRMDLADDCLAALDLVIASVHSAFNQDKSQMTDRLLRAIENPHVDVIGHPTGRLILRRAPYPVDMEAVVRAAARHGVAIEINSQIDRLDASDVHAKLARDHGVPLIISSDAHSLEELAATRWGVVVARRAWLQPSDVLNTRQFEAFQSGLRRNRP
jgi:DNA polymerase (family 10)